MFNETALLTDNRIHSVSATKARAIDRNNNKAETRRRAKKDDEMTESLLKALLDNNNTVKAMTMCMISDKIYETRMRKLDLELEGKLTDAAKKVMDTHLRNLQDQLKEQSGTAARGRDKKPAKKRKKSAPDTFDLSAESTNPLSSEDDEDEHEEEEEEEHEEIIDEEGFSDLD